MKKRLVILLLSLVVIAVNAQDKKDTVKIKWRHSRILIIKDSLSAKNDSSKRINKFSKKDFVHWAGVDIGVCMLSSIDNKFFVAPEEDTLKNRLLDLNYTKSLSLSLNFWEYNIRLYKNYINVVTGLGVEWVNYNFRQNITLDPNASRIHSSNTVAGPDSIPFIKNKLKITYATLPLLIELNTNTNNPNKSFHVAGGIELSYRLTSKTKQVYSTPDDYKNKIKKRDDYNLNDVLLSTTVRVGYGNAINLYANYGISQLFKYKKGPAVYPLIVGLSINF